MQKTFFKITLLLLHCLVVLCACDNSAQLKAQKEAQLQAQRHRTDSLVTIAITQILAKDTVTTQHILATLQNKNLEKIAHYTQLFYRKKQNQLAWKPNTVQQFLKILQNANAYGLKPKRYAINNLQNLYTQHLQAATTDSAYYAIAADTLAHLDAAFTVSALALLSDLATGQIKPRGQWDIAPTQLPLHQLLDTALQKNNFEIAITQADCPHPAYQTLKKWHNAFLKIAQQDSVFKPITKDDPQAVQKMLAAMPIANPNTAEGITQLQTFLGLKPTGNIDPNTLNALNIPPKNRLQTFELAMERYRWLPKQLGNKYVWVNLPEFRLYLKENNTTLANITAVIGELKNATPVLIDKSIENVVLSPTWTIPTNIAREEMEFIVKNPSVLITADVDVFLDGKKTDPRNINWTSTPLSRVTMRQRPKARNSMGLAKFPFENGYGIYIHDTPNKQSFGSTSRAESHGCVRIADPAELAYLLLKDKGWTKEKVTAGMYKGKEQYVAVSNPVKVHLVYFTTYIDDNGNLQTRRDVYGHDSRQLKALQEL